MPGPQEQVIRVAQDDLRVEVVQQIAREDAFNRPLGADRHEDRRFDVAVRGVQDARAGTCFGAGRLKLESEHRSYCRIGLDREMSANQNSGLKNMLAYLFLLDRSPWKLFRLIVFLTGCFGSGIYFFAVYRKQVEPPLRPA